MEERMLDALEQGILVGGQSLAPKDFGLKKTDSLFKLLLKEEYVVAEGEKTFSITASGLKFWEMIRGNAYVQGIKNKAISSFLDSIQKEYDSGRKKGGRGKAKAGPSLLQQWLDEAKLQQLFVEEDGRLQVLPAGQDFLFSLLPVEEKIERRKTDYLQRLVSLEQDQSALAQEFSGLQSQVAAGFGLGKELEKIRDAVIAEMRCKAEEYTKAYENSLKTLSNLAQFMEGARKFQNQVRQESEVAAAKIEKNCQEALENLKKLEAQTIPRFSKLEGDILRLKDRLDKIGKEVEEWQLQTTSNARQQKKAQAAIVPTPKTFSEEEIFQTMKAAHQKYCQDYPYWGDAVTIPDLFDSLKFRGILDSLPRFHQLLNKWWEERRISLRVCDRPSMEKRAQEGIPSGHGLLFYVYIK